VTVPRRVPSIVHGLRAIWGSRWTRRNTITGLLFVSPWLLGFLVFELYPIVASGYYSLTKYSMTQPPEWVGLQNYIELFTDDPIFYTSLWNTFYYVVAFISLSTVLAVGMALLMNVKVRGIAFYRTLFYVPSIVPIVAASMLWIWVLNPQYGLMNTILGGIGLPRLGWLSSPVWSKPGLIIMSLWGVGTPMLIYLAALQDIPQELYEAAVMDGANAVQKIRHVTIPLLTPAIFFNAVTQLIVAFQYFTPAYVMSTRWAGQAGGNPGGPVDSTVFYALLLYRYAFVYFKMGYASAMAWILFVVVLVLTILLFRTSTRWVHYGGEA